MYIKQRLLMVSILSILFSANVYSMSDMNMSDTDISHSVSNRYKSEADLKGTSIEVKTRNHVVSLYGTAYSETEADKAVEIAQSTPGVKDVNVKNLKVKGSEYPMKDAYITAKIKGMFIQEKIFGDKDIASMGISVETNNGVVTLSGKADNQDQIRNAIKIAESIKGVKKVESSIEIPTMSDQ